MIDQYECGMSNRKNLGVFENKFGIFNTSVFKGTQIEFFYTFFAETESLWSQGPETRDF
jgi:hypothetical protein